ncbi:MAG: helix-turn-helix domain-containing protein [Bacteroidales bacterium]
MNPGKELASRFINSTGCHVFLTGKAGTGKTTFLRELVGTTHKKTIVAAPTGIASINAGGVTLHSLLQLPFGAFCPTEDLPGGYPIQTEIYTSKSLLRNSRFFEAKRRLLREMELLIIDEVSMLRADTLDAIDTILRHVRRISHRPFGGVQLLFIGDLLQLPPVVKKQEWALLKAHYPSLHFFHARALKQNPPLYIEFEHIYRQHDPVFINLLAKLRENKMNRKDLALLNRHVKHGFDPLEESGQIFLTTHNHKADLINSRALEKLKGQPLYFDAAITGDFSKALYPAEYSLQLKIGAQVMFIKNDHTGEQRYFNGKIGTIEELSKERIVVGFPDGSAPAEVERYTWENKKFNLNRVNNEIEEKVTGTFSHYPIKLAWAVTVHKSQGLTFDKAVIDVSGAFAPGQIYVALSRLRGLEGLVLSEPVPEQQFAQDDHVKFFSAGKSPVKELKQKLQSESRHFIEQELSDTFNFDQLQENLRHHLRGYDKKEGRSVKQSNKSWAENLIREFLPVKTIADRFSNQLKRDLSNHELVYIRSRVHKANDYFSPLLRKVSEQIFEHISSVSEQSGTKGYVRELRELESGFHARVQKLHKMESLITAILENTEPTRDNTQNPGLIRDREDMLEEFSKGILAKNKQKSPRPAKGKPAKTPSAEVSLQLFLDGKSMEEIIEIRSLAYSTIQSHMVSCVQKGLIDAERFVEKEKMTQIMKASEAIGSRKAGDIMAVLGDEFSFAEVRMVMAGKNE